MKNESNETTAHAGYPLARREGVGLPDKAPGICAKRYPLSKREGVGLPDKAPGICEKRYPLAKREGVGLLKYIDHLVFVRSGDAGAFRLNEYRKDALRCILVAELGRLVRNYDSAVVPTFAPFAMAMLKRKASSGAFSQGSAQRTHSEGALGYASLDAPLDAFSEDSDATMHDCVADEAGAVRGERGRRLRRFYRVVARLPVRDREIIEALLACDVNKAKAARRLGLQEHALRYALRGVFARFRKIWAVTD